MTANRREILEQVARGELTPEAADEMLRSASNEPVADPAPTAGIRVVKVTAGFGAIVVEGDESVSEVEIDGQHSAQRDGDVLNVHGELRTDGEQPGGPGVFSIRLGGRRHRRGTQIFRLSDEHFAHKQTNLRIRMNPALELEAKLDAGSLAISGVHAPIRIRLAAGPITVEGSTAPLDISVNAGAIRVVGSFTDGESRLRSDAGAVRVELEPSSSVRILADAALGKILLPGDQAESPRRLGSRREAVVGSGDATLRVETAMGSIKVTAL